MAWRCSALSNAGLVQNLFQAGIVKSKRVSDAMCEVDRAHFVLDSKHNHVAYNDSPQSIGHGATISAPHMHAYALEHLLPYLEPGSRVLDVGSGSGYLCAVLHHLISPSPPSHDEEATRSARQIRGKVVGIEHIPALGAWSKDNLRRAGLGEALDDKGIEIVVGDGREGYASAGPYSAIHVGAAAPHLPQELVDQLASPGRMFIPVGSAYQEIVQVTKDEHGEVTKERLMGVVYVPLTDPDKQTSGWAR